MEALVVLKIVLLANLFGTLLRVQDTSLRQLGGHHLRIGTSDGVRERREEFGLELTDDVLHGAGFSPKQNGGGRS